MGAGTGKDISTWIDDRWIAKLIKLLDRFDLEKRISGKRGQRLFDTLDKNERKRAMLALFCLVATRLPAYSIILIFDRVYKNIKRAIDKKVEISKSFKSAVTRMIVESTEAISRMRSILWNLLSI